MEVLTTAMRDFAQTPFHHHLSANWVLYLLLAYFFLRVRFLKGSRARAWREAGEATAKWKANAPVIQEVEAPDPVEPIQVQIVNAYTEGCGSLLRNVCTDEPDKLIRAYTEGLGNMLAQSGYPETTPALSGATPAPSTPDHSLFRVQCNQPCNSQMEGFDLTLAGPAAANAPAV